MSRSTSPKKGLPKSTSTTSWSNAVDSFVNSLEREERSPHTVHHYRDDLRAFATWWKRTSPAEELTPASVTDFDLSEWQRHLRTEKLDDVGRTRKPAAINAKGAALASFLRWAARTKLIKSMPAVPKRKKLAKRAVKALEPDQQHQLLRHAARRNERDKALLVILLETGVRVAELVAWRWDVDIILSERKGTWEVPEGKGCKPRGPFPMSPRCRLEFQHLRDTDPHAARGDRIFLSQRKDPPRPRNKPLTVRGVQELLCRCAAGLGLDDDGLHPHQLRHSFAFNMRRQDPPVEWRTIADFMGHDSVSTTMDSYGTPTKRAYDAAMNADDDDDDTGDDD